MIYVIESNKLKALGDVGENFKPQRGKEYISVCPVTQRPETAVDEEIPDFLFLSTLSNKVPRFESHVNLDIICLQLSNSLHVASPGVVHIFLQNKLLQFVADDPSAISDFLNRLIDDNTSVTFGKILYLFLNSLLKNDLSALEKMEDQFSTLEDEILSKEHLNVNYSQKVIALSRCVRITKQYYEQFSDIVENLSWNENRFFDAATLKYFKILGGRLDRLSDMTTKLLAFSSEVREAYQMEVDMRANRIMQLFTVVTVIFAPLTLLVGWYGMNLMMPEFHFRPAYPIVIAATFIFSVSIILYFRKRKWF